MESNEEIRERFFRVLSSILTSEFSLVSNTRLRDDLGMDSLQLAVMTVKVEAEFGVDVFADGVVHTVGDVEEKINRHLESVE